MISFEHVDKTVGGAQVLHDVTFTAPTGELVVLVGPSGCGKTTVLKMANRLIAPSAGCVKIDDRDLAAEDPIELRRSIGYVTQHTGLFEHLTVRGNITVSPALSALAPAERESRAESALRLLHLPGGSFAEQYPYQLTNIEKQRLCLARAFAGEPALLLMDDPFAGLSESDRADLQDELVTLQARRKVTVLFSTDRIDEAIKIADRLCILNKGELEQYDKPEQLLKAPKEGFVAEYIGRNRIFDSPEKITAKDIMLTRPIVTYPDVPMLKSIEKMRLSKVDSLLVTDDQNNFLGIVRAEHIHHCDNKDLAVQSVMREAKTTASPGTTLLELVDKVRRFRVNAIPVLDDEKLAGLVTTATIVTTLSQQSMDLEEVELG